MFLNARLHLTPAALGLALLLTNWGALRGADSPEPQPETDEVISGPVRPDLSVEKFWAAVRLLQGTKATDLAAGRKALQAVSDQEYTHAQVLLGNCLASGSYGFTKDARKAFNLFRLAAERGNAFAKVSLGSCYATGTGIKQDDEKAAQWLTAALAPDADFSQPERPAPVPGATDDRLGASVAGELGNDPVSESQASAHFLLGQILGRQKKSEAAHAHYLAAATAGIDGRSGIYGAATQAAVNYAFGQGVLRDMTKATEMLDRSRQLIARQQVRLIHNYVSLMMVDEFAVADLEEKAGEAGADHETALQMNIASLFGDKKSKDYNVEEAIKWYELAAESGQVWAMLQLGLIHARGDLGKPDPAKAFTWFEKAGGGARPKHYLGVGNLAICYQHGFGVAQDQSKAAALFEKHREADIICYLGSIGHCPSAVLSFEEEVALNETWANEKNDPIAQYLFGLRYLNGWGVKADRDTALQWLKKSAKAKHGGALCMLGLIAESTKTTHSTGYQYTSPENLTLAANYYYQGGLAGNADAMANYANMIADGRGVPKNRDLAEATYLICLTMDPQHARAHCNLAVLYEQKLREIIDMVDGRITQYRESMLQHYEEAVRLELSYGARNLAVLYHEGKLVPVDFRKAYGLYEQAAAWGLPAVHYDLGYMHENGQGVPVTLTEAAYHYRLAALDGHMEALRRLVNFYLTGTGVTLNLDRAAYWMQQMASRGNIGVMPDYCDILLKKGDYATVVPILRKLTESRFSGPAGYGYIRLSLCYKRGYGVKPDHKLAQKYFTQAVKLRNSTALYQNGMLLMRQGKQAEALANFEEAADDSSGDANFALGQMYFFGTNVEQDRAKALRYMLAAAKSNQTEALYFLATMTYNGVADAPPLEDAIHYAQRAENIGHPKAGSLREKLEQRLKEKSATPEEASRIRAS